MNGNGGDKGGASSRNPPAERLAEPGNWKERLAERFWRLKLADRAVGLRNVLAAHRSTERLVSKLQDGTLGKPGGPRDGGDDVIHVGDSIYEHHYHGAGAGGKPRTHRGAGARVLRWLAAAGMLAAAAGGGAGGWMLASALTARGVQTAPAPAGAMNPPRTWTLEVVEAAADGAD